MNLASDNIRILSAAMVEKARSGHPGGAMGGADFINVLFSEYLVYDPKNPRWENRDRFFLDPGHMSPMLYSVLTLSGKFSIEEIQSFRQWVLLTPGHPERNIERGMKNTSGPLGSGSYLLPGCGYRGQIPGSPPQQPAFEQEKIYAYISEMRYSRRDFRRVQDARPVSWGLTTSSCSTTPTIFKATTECSEVSTENTAMKYRSWNWNVITIDGNDCQAHSPSPRHATAEKKSALPSSSVNA